MKGLLAAGTIDRESEASLDSEVADIVAGALAFADASQFPDPAEVLTDVW